MFAVRPIFVQDSIYKMFRASPEITIFFYQKTWQALNIAMIGLYYVQMWKWIVKLFVEHMQC